MCLGEDRLCVLIVVGVPLTAARDWSRPPMATANPPSLGPTCCVTAAVAGAPWAVFERLGHCLAYPARRRIIHVDEERLKRHHLMDEE
ncbi:hypothetical protein EDD27_8602 [Nonomuraea polychroma]|uniref:Uncharacterized protein n=1 Tax=Nonomuraea polychroma TaxID=46176 RepID=A0A438MJG9_9ACTN|nr:hypothetical protein EDD27_8602 [Nonomuraea polychroma]